MPIVAKQKRLCPFPGPKTFKLSKIDCLYLGDLIKFVGLVGLANRRCLWQLAWNYTVFGVPLQAPWVNYLGIDEDVQRRRIDGLTIIANLF